MKCYLGIDGGGSGSQWALLAEDGTFRARGDGPSLQVSAMGVEASVAALAELLASPEIDPKPSCTVAGLAGAGRDETRRQIENALPELRVVGDIEVAAAATLAGGPGITVWAGTGSFAVARDPVGRLWRAGGRGPLLGDEGSAYALALAGLRAATRARDRVGQQTVLTTCLPDQVGDQPPATTAALFPVVLGCALEGDPVAQEIIDDGATQLAGLAEVVARKAGMEKEGTRVFLGGGALGDSGYAELVMEQLTWLDFADVHMATQKPSDGAAILACAVAEQRHPLCGWLDNMHS